MFTFYIQIYSKNTFLRIALLSRVFAAIFSVISVFMHLIVKEIRGLRPFELEFRYEHF